MRIFILISENNDKVLSQYDQLITNQGTYNRDQLIQDIDFYLKQSYLKLTNTPTKAERKKSIKKSIDSLLEELHSLE